MRQSFLLVIAFILISPTLNQQVLTNIPFECKGRLDGFWRDLRYCDVFHACVAGIQKRSYGCPQVGERFYFDDTTQKCEFASQNTGGCQANQYYTPVTNTSAFPGSQFSTQAPSEQWKIFAQSREQFSCPNQQDGFYASRWCNVFYRCFGGVSNAFLCPAQRTGGRLWWIQHGLSQSVPEALASCTYPCDTGRQCSSAGGVLVDSGNQISESQQEAETVYRQSLCSNRTGQTGQTGTGQFGAGQTGTGQTGTGQFGTGQTGTGQTGAGQFGTGQTGTGQTGTGQFGTGQTGTGQFGTGQTGTGQTGTGQFGTGQTGTGQTGTGQFGTGQTGTGQTGTGQFGTGQTGTGQTGGGNQGSSSSTGGSLTVNSPVSCKDQADDTYLSSPYCNVFHRCLSGTRFDVRCARANDVPYDLWWNQQTNRCDWPCRVQCNNQLYGSSMSAQQVSSDSLVFFNNDCRGYPLIFNSNKQ